VTVVLVTHVMDEAERLCDRLAVFRDGRIVAMDTPAALIAGTAIAGIDRPSLEDAVLNLTDPTQPN
jgi:ABC-2 type transport system ATP-binding protein